LALESAQAKVGGSEGGKEDMAGKLMESARALVRDEEWALASEQAKVAEPEQGQVAAMEQGKVFHDREQIDSVHQEPRQFDQLR